MKRTLRENDLPLICIGLILLSASIFISTYGDESAGVALFEIGGLMLGGGLWLRVTRYI